MIIIVAVVTVIAINRINNDDYYGRSSIALIMVIVVGITTKAISLEGRASLVAPLPALITAEPRPPSSRAPLNERVKKSPKKP